MQKPTATLEPLRRRLLEQDRQLQALRDALRDGPAPPIAVPDGWLWHFRELCSVDRAPAGVIPRAPGRGIRC